jgi:hypothetical protein
MTDEMTLPGLENPAESSMIVGYFGQGPTEVATREAIAEIEEEVELTGAKRAIKQLCFSLAASVDKGNLKGRAVANEAAQLFAMMQQLSPPDADTATDLNMTPDLKRLFDVFAAPAQLDAAPEGDAPQL